MGLMGLPKQTQSEKQKKKKPKNPNIKKSTSALWDSFK